MYAREQLQLARDSAQEIHNRLEDAQQEVQILNDKLADLADEVEVEITDITSILRKMSRAGLTSTADQTLDEAIERLEKLVEAI